VIVREGLAIIVVKDTSVSKKASFGGCFEGGLPCYGFPSLISTTGVVEAPAKPRDFYLEQQLGVNLLTLKEEFKGKFIDYNDLRLTEVMKGYVMQALFFHITGNPFCKNKNCRLYNAHWQEDLIQAQLTSKTDFCGEHKKILTRLAAR